MIPFRIDLSGKIAAVTGGGGVLCSAFCRALAECGAKVAVLNRTLETAQAVATDIEADGGSALALSIDVLDTAALERARQAIESRWGAPDILINGAGGNSPRGNTSLEFLLEEHLAAPALGSAADSVAAAGPAAGTAEPAPGPANAPAAAESVPGPGPASAPADELITFYDIPPEGFRQVFDLNLLGTLQASQALTRGMALHGRGTIINISSMAAYSPLTKVPAYAAAKAAVNNFTQWLAAHLSKRRIRVNAIAPGFYITNQNRGLMTNPDGSWTPRARNILKHIPQDRFGSPEDLLGTLLWLIDEKASGYVTGTVVPVDGGFSAFHGI